MNDTNKESKFTCNSVTFEEGAKVITFKMVDPDSTKDFPQILEGVIKNEMIAPETPEEAKALAKTAQKSGTTAFSKNGAKITTKEVAELRKRRNRKVESRVIRSDVATRKDSRTEDSSR